MRMAAVLVITGAPATGKSTIGRRLAQELRIPYVGKDDFKESLFDTLGSQDRAWSIRLNRASNQLLFRSATFLLEAGQSVALESNFLQRYTQAFLSLRDKYGCRFVQVMCTCDEEALLQRFRQRALSGERHPGHGDANLTADLIEALRDNRWLPLSIGGPLLVVDTTNQNVDFDRLLAQITLAWHEALSSAELV
jgi:predicted kinase